MEPLRLDALRDIEPRASGFRPWLTEFLDNDASEIEEAVGDERLRLDYLFDYLRDEKQIDVRPDGLVSFWKLEDDTAEIIGAQPIVVFHHTADGAHEQIERDGLCSGVVDSSRWGLPSLGVYVTTECSGPAVEGYMRRAEQTNGGEGRTYSIVTRLSDLQPDTNDEDIQSGHHQFVLPYVAPQDILELREAAEVKAPISMPGPPLAMDGRGGDGAGVVR